MTTPTAAPSAQDHAALLREIGPLPLSGQAWPDWVRILAWILLALLGMQLISTGIRMPASQLNTILAAGVGLCFLGLAVVSWNMQVSITTIDERGLRQRWFTRREVAWEDIQAARFVPLLFSKRLVIFTRRGRPIVFQGGTRELQAAFSRISQLYRRNPL